MQSVKLMLKALLVGVVFAALATTALAAPKGSRWGAGYFPNFEVTSHNGKTYRFYKDLIENKIVVINFIYTHCPDICGLQSARMSIVQDKLGDRLGKDIFIYSISLDPERDTPTALKQYAEAFGAKPGWIFLTGKPAELHQIRFKLGERSRKLSEHRMDAVLGNDNTGEWGRSSMMSNLGQLSRDILEMDPAERRREPSRQARKRRGYAKAPTFKIGRERGQALFLKACAACHSIGMGKRIGPDLEGVTERRQEKWLVDYMTDPVGLRARRDPTTIALRSAFPNVYMPDLGLSKIDAGDLIVYLTAETRRLSGKAEPGKPDKTASGSSKAAAAVHSHHKHQ